MSFYDSRSTITGRGMRRTCGSEGREPGRGGPSTAETRRRRDYAERKRKDQDKRRERRGSRDIDLAQWGCETRSYFGVFRKILVAPALIDSAPSTSLLAANPPYQRPV